jgi:allantoinase
MLSAGGMLVEDGRITGLFEAAAVPEPAPGWEVHDVRGSYVLPGAVDAHVHCFSDRREGFAAATAAAAAGGVTTIIDMPFDQDAPVDEVEVLTRKIALIAGAAHVDVALHGTVRPGSAGDAIAALAAAGVCGFKVSLFETDPVRFPRIDNSDLLALLGRSRAAGLVVGVHAEDGEIIRGLVATAKAEGRTRPIDHCLTRPPVSETASVALGLMIARAAAAPFHIFHASLPETVALVSAARAAGDDVSLETCPHYLLFSQEDMAQLGPLGKINPPLRSPDRVTAMWELLAAGEIDMVTSDHAPWPMDRKSDRQDIFANASGAPGLQTLVPLLLSEGFSAGRVGLLRLAAVLAENPARRFNLGHRKGRLEVGLDADYVIFDPAARWTLTADNQLSNAGWTPYQGRRMAGQISQTVVRGNTVYEAGSLTGPPLGEHVRGR